MVLSGYARSPRVAFIFKFRLLLLPELAEKGFSRFSSTSLPINRLLPPQNEVCYVNFTVSSHISVVVFDFLAFIVAFLAISDSDYSPLLPSCIVAKSRFP